MDFAGAYGAAQRFEATVGVINAWGYSGMDGQVQALVEELSTLTRFTFSWPQHMGTAWTGTEDLTLGLDAAVGDHQVRVALPAGTSANPSEREPPKVGRLIQFAKPRGQRKLHRVLHAPTVVQRNRTSSPRTFVVGVYPAITEPLTTGTRVIVDNVSGLVRFVSNPDVTQNRGIVLESVFVVREQLK